MQNLNFDGTCKMPDPVTYLLMPHIFTLCPLIYPLYPWNIIMKHPCFPTLSLLPPSSSPAHCMLQMFTIPKGAKLDIAGDKKNNHHIKLHYYNTKKKEVS